MGSFYEDAIARANKAFNVVRAALAAVKPMVRLVMLGKLSHADHYVRPTPNVGTDLSMIPRRLFSKLGHDAQNCHPPLSGLGSLCESVEAELHRQRVGVEAAIDDG